MFKVLLLSIFLLKLGEYKVYVDIQIQMFKFWLNIFIISSHC